MNKSKLKVLFYYKNLNLWKNISITNTKKKKWINLKNTTTRGKYIYHYKKLKIENLYNYKFINKQILRKYLTIYKDTEFKSIFRNNYLNFEKRLDFNLYHANFVNSLYAAKFFITKGCVFVNNKKITSFNYILKKDDIVTINKIFYNFIMKNLYFTNFIKKNYIRNLEIDYKTFSFIFLDNINYYILNYDNFIKKIYVKQFNNKKSLQSSNIFNYSTNIYNFRNKYIYNNYFNFFKHIYIYYIWLDKKNQYFKYRNIHYDTNYSLKLLSKLLQKKYNSYYFRNILLKRIFNYKYNYLKFLQKTKVFNNYFNFQNLDSVLNLNIHFTDNSKIENTNYFINELFKYVYTLIFKYFIYLFKNYYINNINYNNMNEYIYYLFLNKKIFQLIIIKNKLNNYYTNNYSSIIIANQDKISKIINYKFIESYKLKNTTYRHPLIYKKLIGYILSKRYKYRIYRKCHSFRQNKIRRLYLIEKIKKSFFYTKYNCNRCGSNYKLINKNIYFNKLSNINKLSNKFYDNYKIKTLYYPQYSSIYNNIFQSLIKSINIDKQNLLKNRSIIWNLRKQLYNFSNTSDLKSYLYNYELKITLRLNFLKFNKTQNNLNFNHYYKDLFLIRNLISTLIKYSNLNYNLKYFKTSVGYKMHYKYNINQIQSYTNKKYRRLAFYYRRFVLNYYYINYNKTKLNIPSNLRKNFLIFNSFKNVEIKSFFNNYKHYFIKRRKNYFKPLQHYRYINYIHRNVKKNKKFIRYKKYNKFNRMYFIIKYRQTKQKLIKFKSNQNIFYYMNLNLIELNSEFKDNLFFIDLLLNLYIRKLNTNYNTLIFKNIRNLNLINKYAIYSKNKNYFIKKRLQTIQCKKKYIILNKKYINLRYMRNYILANNYFNSKICYTNNKNFYKYNIAKQLSKLSFKQANNIFIKFNKKNYINNMYKIYIYYTYNIKKYKLIKYIFKNYILKEYQYFINLLMSNLNIKTYSKAYIKNLYYNLLFSQLYNIDKYDFILKNNYNYSKNLKIIINYFIIINRLYK